MRGSSLCLAFGAGMCVVFGEAAGWLFGCLLSYGTGVPRLRSSRLRVLIRARPSMETMPLEHRLSTTSLPKQMSPISPTIPSQ